MAMVRLVVHLSGCIRHSSLVVFAMSTIRDRRLRAQQTCTRAQPLSG
jgi:hypothetical protein